MNAATITLAHRNYSYDLPVSVYNMGCGLRGFLGVLTLYKINYNCGGGGAFILYRMLERVINCVQILYKAQMFLQ